MYKIYVCMMEKWKQMQIYTAKGKQGEITNVKNWYYEFYYYEW